MNQELKNALRLITEKCKQPNFYEVMESSTLKQRIQHLKGNFVHFVDHQTIWYSHGVNIKKGKSSFDTHPQYTKVELTKKQRQECIQELIWLERDVQACIAHLKNE
jgi:hypothetical protein